MRLLPVAMAGGWFGVHNECLRADSVWSPTQNFYWSNALNWTPAAVPGTGATVDLNKSTSCIYNVATGTQLVLSKVSVLGGVTLSFAANSELETPSLVLGGTYGNIAGNTSAGLVTQSTGTVQIDPGGTFGVDSASTYTLSGTSGFLTSYSNELLGGTFAQSGGNNTVNSGYSLNNSGLYTINNTSGGVINCDTIINTGTFNQSGATLEGATVLAGTFNFSNSGTFVYTLGNFDGVMNNIGSVQLNGTTIPFFRGLVNNGLCTVNGSTGTFAGPISGGTASSSLYFKGSTNVTLSGSNTYVGATTVATGTVILASPVGTSANNYGGSLQGNVSIGTTALLQLNADSQIANNIVLTLNGGTLNLNGHNESIGSLVMNGGTIQQSSGGYALGDVSGLVTVGRGTSTINGGLRSNNPLNFTVASNGIATVMGTMSNLSSGAESLTLGGGGNLYFSGASLLSTIEVMNGILQVAEGGNLGGVNTLVTLDAAGSLSLNNQALTIGDLTGNPAGTVATGTGSLTINSSATGSTFPGIINGSGSLTKSGSGPLTLTGAEMSTGTVSVNAGTLTMASTSTLNANSVTTLALATTNLFGSYSSTPSLNVSGTVNISPPVSGGINVVSVGAINITNTPGVASGQLNVLYASPHTNHTLLTATALTIAGASGAWAGQVDLSNNDMDVQNSSLSTITDQVRSGYNNGLWNGTGITSSAAAVDTTHLTALGVIVNDIGGGTPLYGLAGSQGLFDGYNPYPTDVLIRYTYVGDANLDGQVDGSDYSLIDNGALFHLTGWYNGDFNYDGVINGSDYTLIDNAFNTQGPSLTATDQIAVLPTDQIAGVSAVPEPGMLAVGSASLLLMRRRRGYPA